MPRIIDYTMEFYNAYGVPILHRPGIPSKDRQDLRIKLLKEELDEFIEAVCDDDIVAVADALTDLQVILDGTFLEFGLGFVKEDLMMEVHRSNMSKLDKNGKPIYREDGKVLKGPNFSEPDLLPILEKQNKFVDTLEWVNEKHGETLSALSDDITMDHLEIKNLDENKLTEVDHWERS